MEIVKQPDFQVFASEAKTGEVLKFPDILRGWGVTLDQTQGKPPLEWMNDAFKRIDINNLYHLQQGLPEWHKSVRYPKSAVVKNNGKIYICLAENENNEPHLNSEKWSLLITKATTSQQGIVQLTSALTDREDLAATPKMVSDIGKLANNNANTRLEKSRNLSDLTNITVARNNLGLGTSATMNSTSTLSDRTDQAATIKVVNDVNRVASTAQKTANNAHTLAQSKQDKLTFVGEGPDVMKTGAFGLGNTILIPPGSDLNNYTSNGFYAVRTARDADSIENLPDKIKTKCSIIIYCSDRDKGDTDCTQIATHYNSTLTAIRTYYAYSDRWTEWHYIYNTENTTPDKSGFLRASGNANALVESDVTNSLGNSKSLVASQFLTSDVAQKATNAHYRADESYTLAEQAVHKKDIANVLGDSKELVASQALVKSVDERIINHGLGYGQKWVDVTNQRAANTNYVNNTNKPIFVIVTSNYYQFKVNGNIVASFPSVGDLTSTSVIILPGDTYSATKVGNWWEVR